MLMLSTLVSLLVTSQGTQFITGTCKADSDCASGCCGFNSGKCAGPVIAQERDGGCGFGEAKSNANAVNGANGGSTGGAGSQFITGPCESDADCASACCGFKSGKCAGPVIAQERDGGCGHGDEEPNNTAAKKFLGES